MAAGRYCRTTTLPPAHAPFLLVSLPQEGTVLVAPFRKRRAGPSRAELALVQAVAAHLNPSHAATGALWIDPRDGSARPAAIGPGQVRRRLTDDASFTVRLGSAQGAPGR